MWVIRPIDAGQIVRPPEIDRFGPFFYKPFEFFSGQCCQSYSRLELGGRARKDEPMIITLKNDFHDTEIKIRIKDGGILSQNQMARIRKTLCGMNDCACGTIRGHQGVELNELTDPNTGKYTYQVIAL